MLKVSGWNKPEFEQAIEKWGEAVFKLAPDVMQPIAQEVEDSAKKGWPWGPEPGGLTKYTGFSVAHSQQLFDKAETNVFERRVSVSVENKAPYAGRIRERGRSSLVWVREIKYPMFDRIHAVSEALGALVKWVWDGR